MADIFIHIWLTLLQQNFYFDICFLEKEKTLANFRDNRLDDFLNDSLLFLNVIKMVAKEKKRKEKQFFNFFLKRKSLVLNKFSSKNILEENFGYRNRISRYRNSIFQYDWQKKFSSGQTTRPTIATFRFEADQRARNF